MLRHALSPLAALALVTATVAPHLHGQRRGAASTSPTLDSAAIAQLRWRHIGPEGNRVTAVAGVAGDPDVYYAGAASGGIWKTDDGGITWRPIFDGHPVQSIGFIAVAPSDPNVVWAGTGEPYIRSTISLGYGVYRSTDAGKTWTKMGLDQTGRIGRIAIDPRDPDVVFVAALGHAYGPQQDRGVFRTTDGGVTWQQVLFVDERTGAYDVEMDPSNPRILFATTWQLVIHTWGRTSGGPGSGMWKSSDGGSTWKRLTGKGLPEKPFGKVDLAIAPSSPNRVYALIETSDGVPFPGIEAERGELWRSDDGGDTWQVVSYDRQLAGRTQYYTRTIVSPDDEDEVYFLAADWVKTLDGGTTTIDPPFAETPGFDHHDIWIAPTDARRMIVAHDGGASITTNRGKSWNRVQLPIAQIYHVTVDNRVPYSVYGNRQDGPSVRGPSNSRMAWFFGDLGVPRGLWQTVGGGESGWATPDPEDPDLVWSSASGFGSVGGIVSRWDAKTGIAHNVEVWPEMTAGHSASEVRYRFVWTFPLTISPHDRNKVYVGSQHVHVTTDGGRTWRVTSPDLTRNDTTRMGSSGGLTPDNIGVEYAGVVFAIAESPVEAGLIWVGTNDGLVHLSEDGGTTWTNLTGNIRGLLEWGTISNIQPSRWDANTAYLTVDGHQENNRDPWIYKTSDRGRSWRLLVTGIPKTPLSYAHWITEDPVRRGLLYVGTENAIYVSFDDGERWQSLQSNLPAAPVHGIAVQEHFNDLVIATYGRGFWILDDVTPLQQLTPEVQAKRAHLFAPRSSYRFRAVEPLMAPLTDPVVGTNPTYGAALNFWLEGAPADSVTFTVMDAEGTEVRTFKHEAKSGINRAHWDLRYDQSKEARMRTSPLHAPEIVIAPEGRTSPSVGRVAMLAPPGRYTVRLRVGADTLSQPLEVLKDPNAGTEEGIRERTALFAAVQTELDDVVETINTLERMRAQLASLKTLVSDSGIARQADSLAARLVAVEEVLVQLKVTGRGQDVIRYPARVGEKLVYLLGDIGSADEPVTAAQREVATVLTERARAARAELDRLVSGEVAAFNRMLVERGMAGVLAR